MMEIGDKVLVSPDLTHLADWIEGEVIKVENNPYAGIVISAQTADGNIFFGYQDWFKKSVRDIRGFKVKSWSDFTDLVKKS
ncbi:transcriptional regulator [Prevotella sp. S7 MS 2]|uniref:transcriptional regulator n=1 Tax=Prevotella sp. S7 MS 2 TaxID=1287488 RepID=UPI000A8A8C20